MAGISHTSKLLLAVAIVGLYHLLLRGTQTQSFDSPGNTMEIASEFVTVRGIKTHTLTVNNMPGWKGMTVVLLHGQAFDAATWQGVGTLAALGEHGIRAIAVDLPGHGVTGGTALNAAERPAFLEELLKALPAKQQPLVLVTPSMSGTYLLGWLADHAAELRAWVAVAPAGLKQWVPKGVLQEASQQPKLKVVGIYGEHDPMKADFALLEEAVPRSQFIMVPNARHACYLDAPDLFNRELLRFLDSEVAV